MGKNFNSKHSRTTWEKVSPWYNKITQDKGHYYHEHLVIPGVLRLLSLDSSLNPHSSRPKLLDLACGNGVLGRAIPKGVEYLGVDIAPSLIAEAKRTDRNHSHKYIIGDVTSSKILSGERSRTIEGQKFTHATIILALQNIKDPNQVIKNVSELLTDNCKLIIVLNHPAFRIPRQSSWGIDNERKIQYRRIDKYMSPMEIPIRMNPSDPNSQNTLSYHFPIGDYSKMLKEAGFVIELIEEWTSDKESVGRAGKMENRSRAEIPLFMAILARKNRLKVILKNNL